ncbi:hypothetical protein IC582_027691 [Cucumis melo]
MEFKNQEQQPQPSKYECLLFDMDDTLYPLSSGLSKQCTINIEEYMVEELGIEKDRVVEMNQFLYRNYGTSMAGLKAIGYEFDNDHYHRYDHLFMLFTILILEFRELYYIYKLSNLMITSNTIFLSNNKTFVYQCT